MPAMSCMAISTHLTLSRASNLPTVWTNVLAAGAITSTGTTIPAAGWISLLAAMSLLYIAGMYYNDVCDVEHDCKHQQYRPIPAGLISREKAQAFAFLYMLIALLLIYTAHLSTPRDADRLHAGWLVSALVLIACIVLYDRHHKNNPFAPLLMAGCRIGVLITTAMTLGDTLPPMLLAAMVTTLGWLIGLTCLARYEQGTHESAYTLLNAWPAGLLLAPVLPALVLSTSAPAVLLPLGLLVLVVVLAGRRLIHGPARKKGFAIALLIAGISLVDGIFLASVWGLAGAAYSLLAFCLTLLLQRWIAGT